MRLAVIVLTILALSGCATQKRCYEKWSMKPDTITKVVTRDSLIYRDTTIYYHLPGDTVTNEVVIPCPPPPVEYIPDTAMVETEFALAKAWWSYPKIKLYLEQKDKYLRLELDSALRESWHWRYEYMQIKQVLKEKYVPVIYKQALSICIFIFAVFIGWFLVKILRK